MAKKIKLIAEFCQNHNGKTDILRRMIDAAAEGGATHAKIQTIFAQDVSFREEFEQGETDAQGKILTIKRPYQPEYERLKGLELSYEQQYWFAQECSKAGLVPLTTAFNLTCIPSIAQLGMRVVKVASYDCGSLPLLQALSKYFDEIIVSTGASYDNEIAAAADLLKNSGRQYSLLHCVTLYPTPLNQMHLSRMQWLRQFAPEVGLSDHSRVETDGVKAALAAIYLGADVIERHFTILGPEESRDGKVSIGKEHLHKLNQFVALSRADQEAYLKEHVPEFQSMLGMETRELSHEELLNRAYYRGRFCNKVNGKQVFNWQDEAKALIH